MKAEGDVADELIEKIRQLPPEKIAEIEDFVDFLHVRSQDQRPARAVSKLSEPSFERVWNNPEDADYDKL